jgi:hypothetical protein
MNPVELNAYRMVLKNGTIRQVIDTLFDIQRLEESIPEELTSVIIATLRTRGKEIVGTSWHWMDIYELVAKSKSEELYKTVDELGYFDTNYRGSKLHLYGKVSLFVHHPFYHPEAEDLAVEELFKWLTVSDDKIRQKYLEELPRPGPGIGDLERELRYLAGLGSPMSTSVMIIEALQKKGSAKARESLRAMEYLFRQRVNDYLLIEQKWAREGDSRALPRPEELSFTILTEPSGQGAVYHLQGILDFMISVAASEPQPEVESTQTNREQ